MERSLLISPPLETTLTATGLERSSAAPAGSSTFSSLTAGISAQFAKIGSIQVCCHRSGVGCRCYVLGVGCGCGSAQARPVVAAVVVVVVCVCVCTRARVMERRAVCASH